MKASLTCNITIMIIFHFLKPIFKQFATIRLKCVQLVLEVFVFLLSNDIFFLFQ